MAQTTLLTQINKLIPRDLFDAIVRRKNANKHSKGIDANTHLNTMLVCQIGNCDSLRDLSHVLRGLSSELQELGISKLPSKSAISYVNAHRNPEVFEELFYGVKKHLGQLPEPNPQERKRRESILSKVGRRIYALDASVVALSARAYPWAHYKATKGGVKLHCCYDWQERLPTCVHVSCAASSDNVAAKTLPLPEQSLILADRGYADFALLNVWDSSKKFFIVRNRVTLNYRILKENPLPADAAEHNVLFDGIVECNNHKTFEKYPRCFRLVLVKNERDNEIVYLTSNNFTWESTLIADLYRERWSIEAFFKELKQGFRVKSFIGTSVNAVLTQIWTALIAQLLVHFLRSRSRYLWSFSNLLNTLRLHLFVKVPLFDWLDAPLNYVYRSPPPPRQEHLLLAI